MRIVHVTYTASIIIFLVFGWKFYNWLNPNYPERFEENVEIFEENEKELNELVLLISKELKADELREDILKMNSLPPIIQEKMEELGFHKIRLNNAPENCASKYIITFEVLEGWNVNELNHVEVIFSPCDLETRKGSHSFDGSHIDVFGLGNGWQILSDTDFI